MRDVLSDHVQTCYGGRVGKSMKGVELLAAQKNSLSHEPLFLLSPHV
jgi:hypothetical protein